MFVFRRPQHRPPRQQFVPTAGLRQISFDAQPDTFAVTGSAATFAVGHVFLADPGTYAVTGTAATVVGGYALNAEPGSYAVTGSDAGLLAARAVSADPGSYAVTGAAATLAAGKVFSLDPGVFAVGGGRSFGNANVGDSWGNEGLSFKAVNTFTLDAEMDVYKMTAYLRSTAGGTQVRKAVIYSDSAGSPNALLGVSNEITVAADNTGSWVEATFATPITLAAGDYWLGWHTGATSGASDSRYVAEIGAQRFNADTYSDGPADPFGAATTGDQRRSIYASDNGPQLSMVVGYAVSANPGSYALSGADADLVYTPVGAYTLDAEPGAFAVAGADAELQYLQHRAFDAEPGAVTVTGQDATLAAGHFVTADPGSYAITGSNAPLLAAYTLSADPGSYSVTGDVATTPLGRVLDAQNGTCTVTGADASLVLAVPGIYVLDAQPGAYTVTGANATTTATRELDGQPSVYSVAGTAATLFGEHSINAATGTYTITGEDATVVADRTLNATPGAYAFTGFNAGIGTIFDLEIDAQPGTYVVTGTTELVWVPGLVRNTTRGGRIRWNTTGGFRSENRPGRLTQNKEGALV